MATLGGTFSFVADLNLSWSPLSHTSSDISSSLPSPPLLPSCLLTVILLLLPCPQFLVQLFSALE